MIPSQNTDHRYRVCEAEEQQRLRQVLHEQRPNALIELVREPEVAVGQLPEVREVLHRQRLIQAVLVIEGGDLRRIRTRPEDRARHPATGDHMKQDEHDQGDPDRDQDRLQHPSDDVAEHSGLLPRPDDH
jgi:hypothetical protein